MEFDYSKLRGRIVEKFGTISSFAQELGWSNTKATRKLNNLSAMYQSDIISMKNLLEIADDEVCEYFFTLKV